MRKKEAKIITSIINNYNIGELSPMIELGSSTKYFRTVTKPHIDKYLHLPMKKKGVRIITTDLKDADGVDISGNIYDTDVQESILSLSPKSLMCCNILEHVEDRIKFSSICSMLLPKDGLLIVTVPYSFPYHADPIDTLYRPTPSEIHELFPDFNIEHESIIEDNTYWHQLKEKGIIFSLVFIMLRIIKNSIWIYDYKKYKKTNNWVLWLWKTIKISFIVLRKK